MLINLNGESREVPTQTTLAALLDGLGIRHDGVVVEHNLRILERSVLSKTVLRPNDTVELIHFVGGG